MALRIKSELLSMDLVLASQSCLVYDCFFNIHHAPGMNAFPNQLSGKCSFVLYPLKMALPALST